MHSYNSSKASKDLAEAVFEAADKGDLALTLGGDHSLVRYSAFWSRNMARSAGTGLTPPLVYRRQWEQSLGRSASILTRA